MFAKFTDFGAISWSSLLITPRRGAEVSPREKQNKDPAPGLHLFYFVVVVVFLETTHLPNLVAAFFFPQWGDNKSLNYSLKIILLAKSHSDLNFFSWHSFSPATSDLISYLHEIIMG